MEKHFGNLYKSLCDGKPELWKENTKELITNLSLHAEYIIKKQLEYLPIYIRQNQNNTEEIYDLNKFLDAFEKDTKINGRLLEPKSIPASILNATKALEGIMFFY